MLSEQKKLMIERRMQIFLSFSALLLLMLFSKEAIAAAGEGLQVCLRALIPSLFPFFVLSNLLSAQGFPEALGRRLEGPVRRFFGIPGVGAAAFFIGLTGGYPLGAVSVAELYRAGLLDRQQAERMLAFCNNTGPAFLVGTAGVGVFGSLRAGLALYAAHFAAAVVLGLLLRPRGEKTPAAAPARRKPAVRESFAVLFTDATKKAVNAVLQVCGFVLLFSAAGGVLRGAGVLGALSGALCRVLPLSRGQCRALLAGFLELGGGVAALRGLPADAAGFALCAFLLGWGGLSVHCQTFAALAGTDIKPARHFAGRALHGVFSAIFALGLYSLL